MRAARHASANRTRRGGRCSRLRQSDGGRYLVGRRSLGEEALEALSLGELLLDVLVLLAGRVQDVALLQLLHRGPVGERLQQRLATTRRGLCGEGGWVRGWG